MSAPGPLNQEKMTNRPVRFPALLRQPAHRQTVKAWWRQIRSPALVLVFLPSVAGLAFVYLAAGAGWQPWISKPLHEILAIFLLGVAVALFLLRAWLYRLKLDYLLLAMAVNFLCREIHFRGTDTAVVVVAACAVGLSLYWAAELLSTLRTAPQVRLALTGTFLAYLLGQLIQRRVFAAGRIPLLPAEASLHVPLEEITENIAHLWFIFIAFACFKELRPADKRAPKGWK